MAACIHLPKFCFRPLALRKCDHNVLDTRSWGRGIVDFKLASLPLFQQSLCPALWPAGLLCRPNISPNAATMTLSTLLLLVVAGEFDRIYTPAAHQLKAAAAGRRTLEVVGPTAWFESVRGMEYADLDSRGE